MRTNSFTQKMSKKSNTELEQIIQEKKNYTQEALQAVIWELENRRLIKKGEIKLEETSQNQDVQIFEKFNENKESSIFLE